MTTQDGCQYLEVTEYEVLCKAANWGSKDTGKKGEPIQVYGQLPHVMIQHCEGPKYLTCTMYKKMKVLESIVAAGRLEDE